MKKIIFPVIVIIAFIAIGIYGKILSVRCNELREKQARQEVILLKQAEILAVNTAMLQMLVSSLSRKNKPVEPGKEGLKIDAIP
ncbi:MAG: hypothetical protein PHV82_18475 [Victivallaceae bacterium]|nr:hypothetical protein [Victivallaceae bacterium]